MSLMSRLSNFERSCLVTSLILDHFLAAGLVSGGVSWFKALTISAWSCGFLMAWLTGESLSESVSLVVVTWLWTGDGSARLGCCVGEEDGDSAVTVGAGFGGVTTDSVGCAGESVDAVGSAGSGSVSVGCGSSWWGKTAVGADEVGGSMGVVTVTVGVWSVVGILSSA